MHFLNSFIGKFKLILNNKSTCTIGKFLMVDGPVYMKGLNNSKIVVGNNCFFNHNCCITSMDSIKIGNNCMFANNVTIIDHDHKIINNEILKNDYVTEEITIGNNVWCGANVVILKGCRIGNNSVIAAGAVVNTNVPDNEIWGGIPAKKIKSINSGGENDR